jgi:hypothetical protein
MKARLGWMSAAVVGLAGLVLAQAAQKEEPPRGSATEAFVGAWRLAWMEQPGADGKLARITGPKGTLMYTRDGRMSVQIQFPESQSSLSNDYVSNGYEASFGTYDVNEEAGTVTRHVEGSVTRGLVGKSLTRAYRFADGRLTMRSVRPDELWSVTWERY